MEKQLVEKLRGYISRCEWKWAKTMPDCPHEYIYQGRCAISYNEYMEFLHAQVYEGEPAFFGKRKINYLYIDGYKYWTMGGYDPENKTMNRQKLFDCYDKIAESYDNIMATHNDEMALFYGIIDKYRAKRTNGSIFEIGSGTGNMLDYVHIEKAFYQGIEPSRLMIDRFRLKHPEFARRVRRKAFEEDGLSFDEYENIVALFGTASYIMKPYLDRLAGYRKSNGLFLMFFADGFDPDFIEGCSEIPHFKYTDRDIEKMFNGCSIKRVGNYNVVTNYNIDLDKISGINATVKAKQIPIQTSLF